MGNVIQGRLIKIIYENKKSENTNDDYFCIAIIRTHELVDGKTELIVQGKMSLIPRRYYEFNGQFINHPKHGKSLKVFSYNVLLPTSKAGWIDYFCNTAYYNINAAEALIIINKYGVKDPLNKILLNKSQFLNLSGINETTKTKFLTQLENAGSLKNIKELLSSNKIDTNFINSLLNKHKNANKVLELLNEKTYKLFPKDIESFSLIDKIYLILHPKGDNDLYRIASYITHTLLLYFKQYQHTTILLLNFYNILNTVLKEKFDWSAKLIDDGMNYALKFGLIKWDPTRPKAVTLPILLTANNIISKTMTRCLNYPPLYSTQSPNINIVNNDHLNDNDLVLDSEQLLAVKRALHHNISVITGGPGTGKTVIIKKIIALIKQSHPSISIKLTAPTGKAVNMLKKKTKIVAQTIHSLIHWDPSLENEVYLNNQMPKSNTEVLIIDEMSMVDTWLLAAAFNACPNLRNIIFVGDVNQLQSIEPGNCLADIINTQKFPVTYLKTTYRQSENNEIRLLAEQIQKNDYNQELSFSREVSQYEVNSSIEALKIIVNLHSQLINSGVDVYQDMQILSPMYKGHVGIHNINKQVQKCLQEIGKIDINQSKYAIPYSDNMFFYVNDKVMNLKNDIDRNVFNGDIGQIIKINPKSEASKWVIKVKYFQANDNWNIVEYNRDQILTLSLAYAISVHKVQGSEIKNIIFAFDYYQKIMLQKQLFYTAVTRAQNHLSLVGPRNLILYASDHPSLLRHTMLELLLTKNNIEKVNFYD